MPRTYYVGGNWAIFREFFGKVNEEKQRFEQKTMCQLGIEGLP